MVYEDVLSSPAALAGRCCAGPESRRADCKKQLFRLALTFEMEAFDFETLPRVKIIPYGPLIIQGKQLVNGGAVVDS